MELRKRRKRRRIGSFGELQMQSSFLNPQLQYLMQKPDFSKIA